jgi:hypothetical protein
VLTPRDHGVIYNRLKGLWASGEDVVPAQELIAKRSFALE